MLCLCTIVLKIWVLKFAADIFLNINNEDICTMVEDKCYFYNINKKVQSVLFHILNVVRDLKIKS